MLPSNQTTPHRPTELVRRLVNPEESELQKYLKKAASEDANDVKRNPIRRFFTGNDPVVEYIKAIKLHEVPPCQLDQKLDSPITLRNFLNGLIKFWETIRYRVNWT